MKVSLIKDQSGALRPATEHDADIINKYKTGQPIAAEIKQLSARSLQHHRWFFGAFLTLVMDYWEPSSHLLMQAESDSFQHLCNWLDKNGFDSSAIKEVISAYTKAAHTGRQKRASNLLVDKQGLLLWLKLQVGHYELIKTPSGIVKRPKSINFNSMGEEEFNEFKTKCFNVCWNYILNKKFSSQQDVDDAINELMKLC